MSFKKPLPVFLLLLLVLFISSSPAKAEDESEPYEWVTPAVSAPYVTQGFFQSQLVSAQISYHIYIPPVYATEPQKHFPVIYWLHGSGGGAAGIRPFAKYIDRSIRSGHIPPCLVVFFNGLKNGMYVDSKDGSSPIESIFIQEFVPHIDASFRTIPSRNGRLLDGFSMGGYGAARFGFKYPDLFASVSMMGSGPLQESLSANAPRKKGKALSVLKKIYGGDQSYFLEVSPRNLAAQNAQVIAKSIKLRMVIGNRDELYGNNLAFHDYLKTLKIPHEWIVLEDVEHDAMATLKGLGDRHLAFYRAAFEKL